MERGGCRRVRLSAECACVAVMEACAPCGGVAVICEARVEPCRDPVRMPAICEAAVNALCPRSGRNCERVVCEATIDAIGPRSGPEYRNRRRMSQLV